MVKLLTSSYIDGIIIRIVTVKDLGGDEHKLPGFFAYFQSLDHNGFLEDMEITLIDKTDPSNWTRHGDFWTDTLKLIIRWGLKI